MYKFSVPFSCVSRIWTPVFLSLIHISKKYSLEVKQMELSILSLRVRALSVLRGLQRHPFVSSYLAVFDALKTDDADFARAYGALCAQIFACGDVNRAMLDAVHFDVNTMTDTLAAPSATLLGARCV